MSSDNTIIAASYSDGIIRLFNYLPADANANANAYNDDGGGGVCESTSMQHQYQQQHLIDIKCHLRGDVLVGFSKTDSRTLLTYGIVDGVLMSWKLKLN